MIMNYFLIHWRKINHKNNINIKGQDLLNTTLDEKKGPDWCSLKNLRKIQPNLAYLSILFEDRRKVHPINEYELLSDIPAHEENGDEVFSG